MENNHYDSNLLQTTLCLLCVGKSEQLRGFPSNDLSSECWFVLVSYDGEKIVILTVGASSRASNTPFQFLPGAVFSILIQCYRIRVY